MLRKSIKNTHIIHWVHKEANIDPPSTISGYIDMEQKLERCLKRGTLSSIKLLGLQVISTKVVERL